MNQAEFAKKWAADWNSHDIERVLSHYAEVLEFHSPKVAIATEGAKAFFTTKAELRTYFERAFRIRPNLHFEIMHLCTDKDGVAIIYRGENGAIATELMLLNEHGVATFVRVLYDSL